MASSRQPIDERGRLGSRGCSLVLAAVLVAAAAGARCGSDSAVTTTGPSQPKCQVTLASTQSSIGPDGGMGSVTVTTSPECPWDVSTPVNWLSDLSPRSGQGSGSVQFRVAPNPMPAARDGDIVINDSRLRVTQQAAACQFQLQPAALAIDAAGGAVQVAVSATSGCAWTATADAAWIVFTTPATGSGDGTLGLSLAPNPAAAPRVGTIALADQRVAITQAGTVPSSCTYVLSLSGDVSIAAPGGSGTVAVSTAASCAWFASTSVSWITVTAGGSGTGNGSVSFTVAPNPGAVRTGAVTIANQTFTVTQAAGITSCTYSIGPPDASIPAPGGTGTVSVSSGAGCAWSASSSVPWVTITSAGSGSGNGTVAFSVAANPGSARSGTLSIAGQTFTVNQVAAACTFAINPPDATMIAAGGAGTVAVSAGSGCTWTASSNVPWVTVTSGANGAGDGSVGFSVAPNPGSARTGTLSIAGQTFTVTQAAAPIPCTYAIAPPDASIPAPGGNGNVAVTSAAGCAWTAISNVPWISVTAGASGTGNGSVAFTVAANTGSARSGTLTIGGQTFTVNQAAAPVPCTYSIAPPDASIPAPGGNGNVAVTTAAGCDWTATSNVPWVAVTAGAVGTGNGSVAFTVAANTGSARTGTLTIAGHTFTVNQAAAPVPCTYTIAPPDASIAAPGGSGNVAVTTAAGCDWTATSNVAWVAVTAGASGAGSGSVAFTVAANTGSARSGTITIAGHTFTVNQAAAPAPCTYSINPSSAAIAVLGGTGNVAVSAGAGCTWTASSNANWIMVTAGASGTGNGSVGFSVVANVGSARTGTITIAGQTFTVTQAALVCSYSINPTSVTLSDNAGNSTVAVSAGPGCSWTAGSNAGWITVLSGTSGTGNGSVTFRVTKNDDDDDRFGTLTIAGHTFTVRQRGDD